MTEYPFPEDYPVVNSTEQEDELNYLQATYSISQLAKLKKELTTDEWEIVKLGLEKQREFVLSKEPDRWTKKENWSPDIVNGYYEG